MRAESFHAIVIPISLLGLLGLIASVWFIFSPFPSVLVCVRVVVLTLLVSGFYRVFLMIRQLLQRTSAGSNLPEFPLSSIFHRLFAPLMEEFVRFLLLATVYYAMSPDMTKSMAWIVGITYAVERQIWNLWLFSPSNYQEHYKKFLSSYNDYVRATLECTWHKYLKTEITNETPSFKDYAKSNTSPQISVCLQEDYFRIYDSCSESLTGSESLKTLVSDTKSLKSTSLVLSKPVFNLHFFGKQPPPMPLTQQSPIESPQPRQDNLPGVIDRLYTVSPKNSMYLQYENFKLPRKISFDDDSSTYQSFPPISSQNENSSVRTSDLDSEALTVHSEDTHFGGGGGGNFEYEFPDGSKLKFGGGAGFDFRRGSRESKNSFKLDCLRSSNSMSWDYRWYCWLFCVHNHNGDKEFPRRANNASIRKKLSSYALMNESSSPKVCGSNSSYSSVDEISFIEDLESNSARPPIQNAQLLYRFNYFANRYLDKCRNNNGTSLCSVDPSFARFGVTLLRISTVYVVLHLLSTSMWQVFACLAFAFPFYMRHTHYAVAAFIIMITVIAKLFSVNYLHLQCHRSYKFSILLEFFINSALFVFVISCCAISLFI